MRHFKSGTLLMTFGLLLLTAAAALTVWNRAVEAQGGQQAEEIAAVLSQQVLPAQTETPQAQTATEDQTVLVEEREYLGVLEIPALDLTLPVLAEWSYPGLRTAPCRYTGSPLTEDLVLAGHNYARHFGNLSTLQPGELVTFTDATGIVYRYTVALIETLPGDAVEEMTGGDWALTLFTCTLGGQNRVTVRCQAETAWDA